MRKDIIEEVKKWDTEVLDEIYRFVWHRYTMEDVERIMEEEYPSISESEKDEIADSVARAYVYDGKYDCNLSYWDNIRNLIARFS